MRRLVYLITAAGLLCLAGFGSRAAAQQIEVLAGQPFGVGRIMIPFEAELSGDPWADGRIEVTERSGRLLYPVNATGPVRKVLREFIQAPPSATVLFLFTGREPLDLTVYTPRARTLRVTPAASRPNRFNNLLMAWWRDYARTTARHDRASEYPGLVGDYLTLTLSRRLQLPPPRFEGLRLLRGAPERGLAVLLGTESARIRIEEDVLGGGGAREARADQPLPEEVPLAAAEEAKGAEKLAIEPIARHVPAECFYLRSGTFANYVWMRSTLDEWGGELRNLIAQRGVNYGMNPRMERRLALKETVLSRTFGGTLISDVAVIGNDPFLREGAGMGMLFEARNNLLLANSIGQQRADAIAQENGRATERDVEIGGQKARLLSTPDGAVRSFYVVAGDYHLVTTSETLARRFVEVSGGKGSLGESSEFRAARARLPVSREDTLFLYVSKAFLRNLASPRYQIEMTRRLRSDVEIESLRLARLAAAAEKKPGETIEQLVEADLLPRGFGRRPDGSRLKTEGDRVYDSLRGEPRLFVPLADMKVESATAEEIGNYQRFAETVRDELAHLDPIVAAVKRFRTKTPGQELVRLEVSIPSPTSGLYGWVMQFLGEPTDRQATSIGDELVRIEGMGRGGNYLTLGIQDFDPPVSVRQGRVRWDLESLKMAQGYLGGFPTLGTVEPLIQLFQGGLTGPPDAQGYARYAGGLWQRSDAGKTVVSFDHETLAQVTPRLALKQAPRPAQLRARAGDLSKSKLAVAINAIGYQRGRDISVGNAEFLQSFSRQLHVPRENCLAVAESLLRAGLVCPLGGRYELVSERDGPPTWVSTAWSGPNRTALADIPVDYKAQAMQWFRGVDLEFSAQRDMIALRADVTLQHKPAGAAFILPGFAAPANPQAKPLPEQSPKIEELPPVEELPAPK